uniref:hypothetical protein n=1 Tax=Simiaoa sp. TaxID=2944202 RepID=UPI003F7CD4B1
CIGNDIFEINVSTNIDNITSSKLENKSNTCDSLPEFHLTIESCYDNPNEPVADQSYNVGDPNWND